MTKINGHVAPRYSSRRWPIIVIAMLAGHLAIMATAVTLASRSHYDVIPNYYQRAVDWDKNRAPAVSTPVAEIQANPTTKPAR